MEKLHTARGHAKLRKVRMKYLVVDRPKHGPPIVLTSVWAYSRDQATSFGVRRRIGYNLEDWRVKFDVVLAEEFYAPRAIERARPVEAVLDTGGACGCVPSLVVRSTAAQLAFDF